MCVGSKVCWMCRYVCVGYEMHAVLWPVCVGTRLESEVGVSSSQEDKAITLSFSLPTLVGGLDTCSFPLDCLHPMTHSHFTGKSMCGLTSS